MSAASLQGLRRTRNWMNSRSTGFVSVLLIPNPKKDVAVFIVHTLGKQDGGSDYYYY